MAATLAPSAAARLAFSASSRAFFAAGPLPDMAAGCRVGVSSADDRTDAASRLLCQAAKGVARVGKCDLGVGMLPWQQLSAFWLQSSTLLHVGSAGRRCGGCCVSRCCRVPGPQMWRRGPSGSCRDQPATLAHLPAGGARCLQLQCAGATMHGCTMAWAIVLLQQFWCPSDFATSKLLGGMWAPVTVLQGCSHDGTVSLEHRSKGSQCFKAGSFREAAIQYTRRYTWS